MSAPGNEVRWFAGLRASIRHAERQLRSLDFDDSKEVYWTRELARLKQMLKEWEADRDSLKRPLATPAATSCASCHWYCSDSHNIYAGVCRFNPPEWPQVRAVDRCASQKRKRLETPLL